MFIRIALGVVLSVLALFLVNLQPQLPPAPTGHFVLGLLTGVSLLAGFTLFYFGLFHYLRTKEASLGREEEERMRRFYQLLYEEAFEITSKLGRWRERRESKKFLERLSNYMYESAKGVCEKMGLSGVYKLRFGFYKLKEYLIELAPPEFKSAIKRVHFLEG